MTEQGRLPVTGIVLWPNPVLTTPAAPVPTTHVEHFAFWQRIVWDMDDLVKRHDAAGLSAPQINWPYRLVVTGQRRGMLAMFNPEIVERSPTTFRHDEGCLSLPGRRFRVERHAWVVATWTTIMGDLRRERFADFSAAVVQHELDHLDGRLICDHGEEVR